MTPSSNVAVALLMMRLLLLLVMMRRHGSEAQRSWTTSSTGLDQIGVGFWFVGHLLLGYGLLLLLLIVQVRLAVSVVMVVVMSIASFRRRGIVGRGQGRVQFVHGQRALDRFRFDDGGRLRLLWLGNGLLGNGLLDLLGLQGLRGRLLRLDHLLLGEMLDRINCGHSGGDTWDLLHDGGWVLRGNSAD